MPFSFCPLQSGGHIEKQFLVFALLLVLLQYSSYKSSYLWGRDMRPLNWWACLNFASWHSIWTKNLKLRHNIRIICYIFFISSLLAIARGVFTTVVTYVHLFSCLSQNLPAPDNQITNTDDRALRHTCIARWVSRGWVGIPGIFNIHLRLTRPPTYKKSKQCVFEKHSNIHAPLRPH